MVLWWVDRDKWQREKDLLNWERSAEEGEQGSSSSIKGCVLLSQLSKSAGEHPCWWKVIETAKYAEKGFRGKRGQGDGTSATGADQSKERKSKGAHSSRALWRVLSPTWKTEQFSWGERGWSIDSQNRSVLLCHWLSIKELRSIRECTFEDKISICRQGKLIFPAALQQPSPELDKTKNIAFAVAGWYLWRYQSCCRGKEHIWMLYLCNHGFSQPSCAIATCWDRRGCSPSLPQHWKCSSNWGSALQ